MSYTSIADLAAKLKVRVTPENEPMLQAAIDAAAEEIDHHADRLADDPIADAGELALAGQINLARAVEWWKAADAVVGAVGFADTGVLQAPKGTFERVHGVNATPLRRQWGVS